MTLDGADMTRPSHLRLILPMPSGSLTGCTIRSGDSRAVSVAGDDFILAHDPARDNSQDGNARLANPAGSEVS